MNEVRVPEAVAAMLPGPELAAVLNGLDHASVANADTVVLAQAWARQLAHVQARFLDALVHVGRSAPFSGSAGERPSVAESARRLGSAGEWAAAELAAAMRWTHRHAEQELGFAESLVAMPLAFAACDAGLLDRGRAWVLADVLGAADLMPEQVAAICAAVVPSAPGWTTSQLRARLTAMVLDVDPGYAARRYRAAVRDRGVTGYIGKDGTGTISGHGLAMDEAVAACERLEALADDVRRAGHQGPIGQIRADLFTRLLDGRFHGLTRGQMVAALLAEVSGVSAGEGAGDDDSAGSGAGGVAQAPGPSPSSPPAHPAGAHPRPAGEAAGTPSVSAGELSGGEIRVGLGTLLGLDERAGEIPGWGPVPAEVARSMVASRRGAQWRFAVTDDDGHLIFAGVTRRRPRGTLRSHDGVVELHVSARLLGELVGGATGEWAGFVADVARQYTGRERLNEVLRRRPGNRFAHADLRRHVQVRDRRCVAPGCRRPARRCQLDHTLDHARGGATVEENSGPLCLRHHLMKHEGGWRLEQVAPGDFRWTSPLGQVYRSRGEPICPPAGPVRPRPAEPATWWGPTRSIETPIMERRRGPPPGPAPRARRPDDEPPPF